jgi:hypothetical protein
MTKNSKKEKVKAFFSLKLKTRTDKAPPPPGPLEPCPSTALAAAIEALQGPTTESRSRERPMLYINTLVPTPPPTPDTAFQAPETSPGSSNSSTFHRRHSLPNSLRTPPSPSPSSPQRKSSIASLNFLKTARQRRLQEIREGKLPASPTTSEENITVEDEEELAPEEIQDPSSSTTYNPENRRKSSTPPDSPLDKQFRPTFCNRPLILSNYC